MIDSTVDRGLAHLFQLGKTHEFPEFVKEASLPTSDEVALLPRTSFADPFNRKFPLHTKASCYLQYCYFLKQKADMEKSSASRMEQAFVRAADFWGIGNEMAALRSFMAPVAEKKASVNDFALSITHQGKNYQFFPIDTPANVAQSARELVEKRARFTYPMRKQAAQTILRKAQELGVSGTFLPDELDMIAGRGSTLKQAALNQIQQRIKASAVLPDKAVTEPLQKLSEAIAPASEILSGSVLEKIAMTLDLFDRFTKFNRYYGQRFPFPEDILFSFTEKQAQSMSNELVELTNGSVYWLADLSKVASAFDIVENLKGQLTDITGSLDLHKIAEIIPTLPRDDAEALDLALAASGVPKANLNKEALMKVAMERVYGNDLLVPAPKAKAEKPSNKPVGATKEERAREEQTKRARETLQKARSPVGRQTDGKFIPNAPNKTETKEK